MTLVYRKIPLLGKVQINFLIELVISIASTCTCTTCIFSQQLTFPNLLEHVVKMNSVQCACACELHQTVDPRMKIHGDSAGNIPTLKDGSYHPVVNFVLIKTRTGRDISQLNQQPPGL